MGEGTLDEPVMAATGRTLRFRGWMVVLLTIVVLALYQALGTWSAGGGLGGVDADGNWVDASGAVVDRAPPSVEVVGHPAPIVVFFIVCAAAVALAVPPVLARTGHDRAGRRLRTVATWAIPVLLVVGVLVYSVWQLHVVTAAVAVGDVHPALFPFGGATATVGPMTR
ncbi:hypothetical protein [Curtobacterium sp. RRHDQ10]|uniref:hypothetical protein n=1 Tax=Curtobacterium phyllosphaerae TaxID=3413379 RepID=UPI003BF2C4B7